MWYQVKIIGWVILTGRDAIVTSNTESIANARFRAPSILVNCLGTSEPGYHDHGITKLPQPYCHLCEPVSAQYPTDQIPVADAGAETETAGALNATHLFPILVQVTPKTSLLRSRRLPTAYMCYRA